MSDAPQASEMDRRLDPTRRAIFEKMHDIQLPDESWPARYFTNRLIDSFYPLLTPPVSVEGPLKGPGGDLSAACVDSPAQEPPRNHARELLGELIVEIENASSIQALRRTMNKRFPMFHCNPPFHTMSPEGKAALLTIVDAAREMFKDAPARPEPTTSSPDTGEVECHGLDTPEMVRFYEHDFYVLSNFSAFKVFWRGIYHDTAEHAYHWTRFAWDGKSLPPEHQHMPAKLRSAICESKSAHEAFRIAQDNKQFQDPLWDEIKIPTMDQIVSAKADQHEYVTRKLLQTGDRMLVEDSWRDGFWGWGADRKGANNLGKSWTRKRTAITSRMEGKE